MTRLVIAVVSRSLKRKPRPSRCTRPSSKKRQLTPSQGSQMIFFYDKNTCPHSLSSHCNQTRICFLTRRAAFRPIRRSETSRCVGLLVHCLAPIYEQLVATLPRPWPSSSRNLVYALSRSDTDIWVCSWLSPILPPRLAYSTVYPRLKIAWILVRQI